MPTFQNDHKMWLKHYAKAKIDFEYMLSTLLPNESKAVKKIFSKSTTLKIEAEKKFADLKKGRVHSVDEWSNWLTYIIF